MGMTPAQIIEDKLDWQSIFNMTRKEIKSTWHFTPTLIELVMLKHIAQQVSRDITSLDKPNFTNLYDPEMECILRFFNQYYGIDHNLHYKFGPEGRMNFEEYLRREQGRRHLP